MFPVSPDQGAIAVLTTPVEPLGPVFVKRDDRVNPRYGGNKPRKLRRLLAEARSAGARRVVTFGAAGSHHALATALFGRSLGLDVTAVLTPQPRSDHAVEVLRALVAQGARVLPVPWTHPPALGPVVAALRSSWIIPPGGSTVEGALGFVDAAAELRRQIDQGLLPCPDVIVVATGSGGTAAGLAAGLAREGLPCRVRAVAVARPVAPLAAHLRALAAATARRLGLGVASVVGRLEVDTEHVGPGYGHPSPLTAAALALAAEAGLPVDPTYTAKALASALAEAGRGRVVLYWHTLSSAPLEPLLREAPAEHQLPAELRALLV